MAMACHKSIQSQPMRGQRACLLCNVGLLVFLLARVMMFVLEAASNEPVRPHHTILSHWRADALTLAAAIRYLCEPESPSSDSGTALTWVNSGASGGGLLSPDLQSERNSGLRFRPMDRFESIPRRNHS
jgi:hypothetical protein